MATMSEWNEVTRFNPCKICGHPDWCSASSDGVWTVCRRFDTGEGLHKVDKNGVDYWLYRLINTDNENEANDGTQKDDYPDILPQQNQAPMLADPDTLNKVYRALLQELILFPEHREALRKRGLNDNEINVREYKTLGPGRAKTAKKLVNQFGADICIKVPGFFMKQGERAPYWTLAGSPGIIVPLRNAQGKIVCLKVRADKPGSGPKYSYITSSGRVGAVQDGPSAMPTVHLPVDSCSSHIDITKKEEPIKSEQDNSGGSAGGLSEPDVEKSACHFDVRGPAIHSNSNNHNLRVRLTEGELKADIATVLSGDLTISIPGVSAWRPALPVLRELAPGKILLAFDVDAHQNYNVARALQNTAIALQAEGFNVELETWPEKWGKGIDDVLASGFTPKIISGREQVSAEVNKIAAGALVEQQKKQQAAKDKKTGNNDNRSAINADYQDLVYQKRACWEALEQRSKQSAPLVFSRSGSLVRIKHTVEEGYVIDVLHTDSLRNIIADITRWYRADKNGNERSVFPVLDTIKGLLSESSPPVPRLRRIVQAPVFSADGTLITTPGYNEKSQTWYDQTCDIPEVSMKPSKDEIQKAKELFFNDLFVDFPFTDELSGVYAVNAAILPFCRQLIDGATPLHLVDAKSGSGTGKSLLADLISIPATGHPSPGMAEGQNSDEWRKRITAKLVAGSQFFLIDNVNQKLDSGELAAAVTLARWEDRLLGESRTIILPVECVWLVTGNSVKTSREIARRMIRINLDAKVEDPWSRTNFKHKSIREWAGENRGQLIWAALTLIQAWIAEGKPSGDQVLGMFESWAEVMGGILDVAGIPGFLSNLREMHRQSDEETEAWQEFLNGWWEKFGSTVVTTGMLHGMAIENDLLLPILGSGSERSQKTILGSALGKMAGRKIGGYEVREASPDKRQRTKRYALVLQKNGADGVDRVDGAGRANRADRLDGADDGRKIFSNQAYGQFYGDDNNAPY